MKNLSAKFFSLLFAFLLWWYVKESSIGERYVSIPVKIFNKPENMVILNEFDKFITVKVSGPSSLVSSLDFSGAYAYLDLRNAREGKRAYPLRFHHRPVPPDVEIVPEKTGMYLDIDYLITKDVEVNLKLSGKLKPGLHIEKIEYSPRFVSIRGPKRYLSELYSVDTYPVDINGIVGDATRVAMLKLPSWVKWSSVKFVNVKIRVRVLKGSRWFVGIPVRVEGLEKNLELQYLNPPRVNVNVSGMRYVVNRMKVEDVKVYLDASIIVREGTYKLPVKVSLPSGVVAVEVIPKFVEVSVEE